MIEKLSAAGAYTFGGLNMAEFAQNPTGHNRAFGDCHNPWNPPYITGGSSSGSGASVAARFNYMALGSDTGGSIRLPAAACGVTGIKPTQTRVSRYGVMPLSFSADNVGPLTRTARDCARVMTLIAGRDPRDPTSSHEPVPDYEAALDGDVRGLRIGVPSTWFLDEVDPPVLEAMERAVAVLVERGATVQPIALPLMDAVTTYGSIVSRVEAATIHAQWMRERAGDYGIHISGRMYGGYAIPATYYVEALARRGPILKAFAKEVFAKVDVLISPTIRTCLPTLAETDIDHGPPGTEVTFMAVSANTRPYNYLGLPAVSVNCGFDPNGCPIGLQIAGASVRRGARAEGGRRLSARHRLPHAPSAGAGCRGRQRRHRGMKPKVAFIGTGGTIASVGKGPLDLQDYGANGMVMHADEIIARWPETALVADVLPVRYRNIPSTAIDFADWKALVLLCEQLVAEHADLAGIVIGHGTATLEETAYILNLTLKVDVPVVLVGAQRPSSGLSTDAGLNLVNAIRVAASPEARGMGVLVVLNDEIQAAREVTKTATGAAADVPLARISACWAMPMATRSRSIAGRCGAAVRIPNSTSARWMRCRASTSPMPMRAAMAPRCAPSPPPGAKGIVSAGFAPGFAPPGDFEALKEAVAQGVVVVQMHARGQRADVPRHQAGQCRLPDRRQPDPAEGAHPVVAGIDRDARSGADRAYVPNLLRRPRDDPSCVDFGARSEACRRCAGRVDEGPRVSVSRRGRQLVHGGERRRAWLDDRGVSGERRPGAGPGRQAGARGA